MVKIRYFSNSPPLSKFYFNFLQLDEFIRPYFCYTLLGTFQNTLGYVIIDDSVNVQMRPLYDWNIVFIGDKPHFFKLFIFFPYSVKNFHLAMISDLKCRLQSCA